MPPPEDPMPTPPERFAWAKLNAYGFVLAGLAILSLADLAHPGGTDLARLAGGIPPGQQVWTIGFGIAGLLLLLGFLRTDRVAETLGLGLLTIGATAQTAVAFSLLGWSEFTVTRLLLVAIIGACTWARVTVLWSRDGLAVTIPPRGVAGGRSRR